MARYSSHAAPAPLSGRVFLKVHYDEREAVKRCGARWDAVLRVWWIAFEDAVENPSVYRWVACPVRADELKGAYDFNNWGAETPPKAVQKRKRMGGKGHGRPRPSATSKHAARQCELSL